MQLPRAVFLALLLCLPLPCLAAGPKDGDLRSGNSAISKKVRQVEDELATMQRELVEATADLQKNEAQLDSFTDKVAILERQANQKSNALEKSRAQLAVLLQAAVRLSHAPPEAMVMMPGDAQEMIKTAKALDIISSGLRKETEGLTQQLGELQKLKEKVSKASLLLKRKQEELTRSRTDLNRRIAERQKLHSALFAEQQAEQERAVEQGRNAETLKDLFESIEQEERSAQSEPLQPAAPDAAATDASPAAGFASRSLRSFAKARGRIHAPAVGRLVASFGDTLSNRQISKGITLRTGAHARVISPFDGEVVFTGPFMEYGKLVIIRHSDDFHTLLAGFETIDITPGQYLLEGEPIGAMGEDAFGTSLYVELRKNNQPIDPTPWIVGLSKKRG